MTMTHLRLTMMSWHWSKLKWTGARTGESLSCHPISFQM